MAGEIETTAAAAGLAGNPAPAGSAAVTDQRKPVKPSLADVLAKQAEGGTLTAQERGILGAHKRKALAGIKPAKPAENVLLSPPPPPVAPAGATAPPLEVVADNPLLAPDAAPDVPAGPLPDTIFDAANCRLAAEALLESLDQGTQLWIGYEAQSAGADARTAAQYESAVAMHPRNRKLMVENSEPVVRALCRWFKCSPEKLPDILRGSGFAAGLIAHTISVSAALKSIRQSQAEKSQQPQPSKP